MFDREGGAEKMEEIKKFKPGLKDYSNYNYRLIQDWQVPEWIKVKPVDENKEENVELGKRARKTIINMDNLTEQQWLKAVEEGEDLQEVMKRENIRREKKLADGGLSNSEEEDFDGSSDPADSNKRRKKSARKKVEGVPE